jgi:folate-binding protein YgfZ
MTNAPYYVPLDDRAVISVRGADAASFLQGLVSCDVRRAAAGRAVLGALLSPQGKFLFDFFLLQHGEGFLLDTEAVRVEEFLRKLNMYRLRAAVEIAIVEELRVVAFVGQSPPDISTEAVVHSAERPDISTEAVVRSAERPEEKAGASGENQNGTPEGSRDDYEILRISLGLPDGSRDAEIERTILLENGYDKLGAVDFTKGCYVGQELTARSKHRGELRKYLFIVRGIAPLPEAGTELTAGEQTVGVMRSSCGDLGLALLRTDRLAENIPVWAGGRPMEIIPPWWHSVP